MPNPHRNMQHALAEFVAATGLPFPADLKACHFLLRAAPNKGNPLAEHYKRVAQPQAHISANIFTQADQAMTPNPSSLQKYPRRRLQPAQPKQPSAGQALAKSLMAPAKPLI